MNHIERTLLQRVEQLENAVYNKNVEVVSFKIENNHVSILVNDEFTNIELPIKSTGIIYRLFKIKSLGISDTEFLAAYKKRWPNAPENTGYLILEQLKRYIRCA